MKKILFIGSMFFAGLSFAGVEECDTDYELKNGICVSKQIPLVPTVPTFEPPAAEQKSWFEEALKPLVLYPRLAAAGVCVFNIAAYFGYRYWSRGVRKTGEPSAPQASPKRGRVSLADQVTALTAIVKEHFSPKK